MAVGYVVVAKLGFYIVGSWVAVSPIWPPAIYSQGIMLVTGATLAIFSQFNHLAEQRQLEKIKTIGDAYMVVGGIPYERDDHAQAVAEMALNMQAMT